MEHLRTPRLPVGGNPEANWGVPHLAHLFPRFASSQPVGGLSFALSSLWLFERAAGARLVGRAPAGARVVAELGFGGRGRPHRWKGWADATAGGDYVLVVPFPTGLSLPTIASEPELKLSAPGGQTVLVAVPEAAVRAGATLQVPEIVEAGAER